MKTIILVALLLASTLALKSTSQTSVQSTGPADVLLDHLKGIQTDIRQEQFEHDQLYEQQHQECEDEFASRTTAIADGEDALARAVAHHARCDAAHLEAEADLAQVRAYQSEIDLILQGLESKRKQQNADFQALVNDELNPAIKAIQGAYPIIDQFSSGNSNFLEVTRHMGNTFKTLVKAGRGADMAAPLAVLAQMGQEFNEESIAQVRSLFERLEADLVDARSAAIELEKQRVQVYNETVSEYNTILQNLAQTADQLTTYSADMAACVVQEQSIIDQASKKVRNNREALKYAIQMCNAFEEEYTNASAGRKAELQLLDKLTEFIREQAEIFGDYGADSSGVFESYKNEYEKQLESQVNGFIQMRQEKKQRPLSQNEKSLKFFLIDQ